MILLFVVIYLELCQPKIYESNFVVFVNHNVCWLDISVDYVLCMEMADCHEQLFHVHNSFLLWKSFVFMLCDVIEKFFALNVFHDQVEVHFIVICLKIFDYVRVVYSGQYLHLLHDLAKLIC